MECSLEINAQRGKRSAKSFGRLQIEVAPKNERKLLAKIGKFNAEQSSNKCGKQQRLVTTSFILRRKIAQQLICPMCNLSYGKGSQSTNFIHLTIFPLLEILHFTKTRTKINHIEIEAVSALAKIVAI